MTETEKEVLKDIALKLWWNLHTGASENLISSLLASSLNDSEYFRKRFCYLVYGRTDEYIRDNLKELYAYTNDSNPYVMKGKAPTYSRSDILIRHYDEEEKWADARKYLNNKKYSDFKDSATEAAKAVHAMFIEVKHASLTRPDKEKYIRFLSNLSNLKHGNAYENKLNKKHKFVIISSHTRKAWSKIDQKRTINDKAWQELTNNNPQVSHILFEDIFKEIKDKWCNECPMLQLFYYYLALYLFKKDNEVFDKYWAEVHRMSKKDFDGLKWEILDYIRHYAERSGMKIEGKQKLDDKVLRVNTVKFSDYGDVCKLRFEDEKNGSDKKLAIIPPKLGQPIEIDKNDGQEEIRNKVKVVLDIIENNS